MIKKIVATLFSLLIFASPSFSQEQDAFLQDVNGDAVVTYLGFGDSITFGIGDTVFSPPAGYVSRLGVLLGINTINQGVPGEELLMGGEGRFPDVVIGNASDIVGIMEGANDAIFRFASSDMHRAYQTTINVARALGKKVLIMTLPAPCCDHSSIAPFTDSYSQAVLDLTRLNSDIRLADFRRAWVTTCESPFECELYNLPEGLHPNGKGYDVMAQVAAAAILGIDIFAADGAANLEAALGLAPGTVIVKPSLP